MAMPNEFSLNNLVPLVAVISMNDERLQLVRSMFAGVNTAIRVFPGVHASAEDARRWGQCHVVCPPKSVVGIMLAHQNVWRFVLENRLPSAAVFEDDVRITESFSEVVPRAMAELPEDWDLLFLGCFTCSKATFADWLVTCCTGLWRQQTQRFSQHLTQRRLYLGAEAYIVSARGARRLLQLVATTPTTHLDLFISTHAMNGLLTCLSVWPQVAYQDSFDSSTNATSSTPRLLSPFVRSLRLNAANPYDRRTVGWVLSLALLEVDPVLSINLWTLVVFVLALALPPTVVFLFLCFESLLCSTTGERRCCAGFWVAALIGCTLRMVVCCADRKSASKAQVAEQ